MPERPIASAAIQTPKVVANWTMIEIGTSSKVMMTGRSTKAQARPAARLPKTVSSNTGATLPKPTWPASPVMIASR